MFLQPIAVKKIVWILLKICPEKKKEKFKQPIISQSKLHVPEMKFVVKELQHLFLYLLLPLVLKFVGKAVFKFNTLALCRDIVSLGAVGAIANCTHGFLENSFNIEVLHPHY